ncbi:MAG: cbiM [Bacillales bacterium]|jgi:cobalt/nickel transport system permease protein|nr:cbiM [Bacillales bacterium]
MHIPDGILSAPVLVTGAVLSVGILSVSVKKTREEFDQKSVPTMGVMAAFIFAAQMLNFPIVGAASGHLMGGALSAILFGFWPSTIIMTTIVAIQALFFSDGGISVFGINFLNMAIIAPGIAAGTYHFCRKIKIPQQVCIFTAGFLSVIATAFFGALQLGLSGVASYSHAIVLLVGWHLLIGVGEGLITMSILPFAFKSRFGQASEKKVQIDFRWRTTGIWLGVAIALGGFVSLLASPNPDGYETAAEKLGVLERAKIVIGSPMPDYALPGLSGNASAIIAGIVGVVLTLGLFILIGKLVTKKQ